MKRKMLLLTLAAMLFGWCGVLAQHEPFFTDKDTLWTKIVPIGFKSEHLKFHPNGETILYIDQSVGIIELKVDTGDSLRIFKHNPQNPQDTIITRFDISPDGTLLFAVDNGGRCYLWSLVSGELIRGFDQFGTQGFFLQNSAKLYVHWNTNTSSKYNLWVYNIETDSVENVLNLGNYTQTTAMDVSKDDKYIVAAALYKDYNQNPLSVIDIFDAVSFENIVNVQATEPGAIMDLKFSNNANWLTISRNKIIDLNKLIDFNTKEEKVFSYCSQIFYTEDEKNVFIKIFNPNRLTHLINIFSNDTLYTNKFIEIGILDFDRINKRYALGCDNKYFTVSNSNLYYLDVPYSQDETSVITMLNYQNGLLNYAANIEYIISIMITDISGTTVYSNSSGFSTTEGQVQIALAKGVYFFTVSYGNKSFSKKFIVIE